MMTENDELEMMWNKVIMDCFKVSYQQFPVVGRKTMDCLSHKSQFLGWCV